ncbi:MAG: sigma-70 family RNA polymerase sigma factor [Bryobacteraceae bacterium]|jgi:RNA polymerase sigma factor (sigma-70 family)
MNQSIAVTPPSVRTENLHRRLEQQAASQAKTNDIVEMIRGGHPAGLEQLYAMARNFTFFIMRQLGSDDLQDKVHDIFVTAATAISAGKLRDSERLTPFLTTLTRFYTYGQIDRRVVRRKYVTPLEHANIPDRRTNLENSVYKKQKMLIVRDILNAMPKRDRDVLERFYVLEQTKEQICQEMNLTPTQFRLLKSKAKSTFAKMGQRRLKVQVAAA